MRLPLAFAASLAAGIIIIAEEPARDPDPIEIITDRGMQGWPQPRIYFADWRFPVDPDPSQFALASDADDVLLRMPKRRSAGGLPEGEIQPPGSPAGKRFLLFLATVSIIAGPKPFPFLAMPSG